MSTSILGHLWMSKDMDNESDEYNEITLKEFQDELNKSLTRKSPSKYKVRWEIDEQSCNSTIIEFAKRQNQLNSFRYSD